MREELNFHNNVKRSLLFIHFIFIAQFAMRTVDTEDNHLEKLEKNTICGKRKNKQSKYKMEHGNRRLNTDMAKETQHTPIFFG